MACFPSGWRIWSWSFLSTSVTEGEWVSRHSWSRQWPVHTDLRELWQTCGNWTTFYKVLCAMVCRVKNKKYFSFAFLLSLFSFCISSVLFFCNCLFFSDVATVASLHPHGRHWLSITKTIWTSQLLMCSKISQLCYCKTGIGRRGIELLGRFSALFPMKVPWNQAHNSGVSLASGSQWPVTSCFILV